MNEGNENQTQVPDVSFCARLQNIKTWTEVLKVMWEHLYSFSSRNRSNIRTIVLEMIELALGEKKATDAEWRRLDVLTRDFIRFNDDLQDQALLHHYVTKWRRSKDEDFWNQVLFEHLIACGADPNCRDLRNNTPLHMVSRSRRGDAKVRALALLDSGACSTHRNDRGKTPADVACTEGIRAVLQRPCSLKCMAAHAVIHHNILYRCLDINNPVVPEEVEDYLDSVESRINHV